MMISLSKAAILLSVIATSQAQTVIDRFQNRDSNALGNWHGCDEGDGITCTWGTNQLKIQSSDVDYSFYTQLNNGCQDLTSWNSRYLHVKLSGSKDFTIALQQNNPSCNEQKAPYPETWDTVYAADYVNTAGTDVYIPLSHFNINKARSLGFAFKAFRSPKSPTTLTLIEVVTSLPSGVTTPAKKATSVLAFGCTRPNSIAFGIDDGVPGLAQRTMQIIRDAGIKVTFFTVGSALYDKEGNFTAIYKQMLSEGHQVALHTMTHPKLESLTVAEIDKELADDVAATKAMLNVTTKYFRAPYGTDGALTRQRVEANLGGNSKIINWSIDIEDWLWGESNTPEKQVDAVKRDIAKGGNLFVAHYLYESTVKYFPEFIALAKATGKQIMRIDQCLEDPNAPPL